MRREGPALAAPDGFEGAFCPATPACKPRPNALGRRGSTEAKRKPAPKLDRGVRREKAVRYRKRLLVLLPASLAAFPAAKKDPPDRSSQPCFWREHRVLPVDGGCPASESGMTGRSGPGSRILLLPCPYAISRKARLTTSRDLTWLSLCRIPARRSSAPIDSPALPSRLRQPLPGKSKVCMPTTVGEGFAACG